jgi:hypothetical protein
MEGRALWDGEGEFFITEPLPCKNLREAAGIPLKLISFAKQMQRLHDTSYSRVSELYLNVDMRQKFIALGMAHGLELDAIEA